MNTITGFEQAPLPIALEIATRIMTVYRSIPAHTNRYDSTELAIMAYEDAQALISVHNTIEACAVREAVAREEDLLSRIAVKGETP